MHILAMDTSNQILGLAVAKDNNIIAEYVTNVHKNHSERLMPALEQLFKTINMSPEQIDKIVVAKGPGSYTGVRIGLTTAKTFAWALDIPIVSVSSLEVLSYQGRFSEALICPFFDARRGLVFTGLYQASNEGMTMVQEEQNILMEDWLQILLERNEKIMFLSPDIELYKEKIQQLFGDMAIIPNPAYHIPNPSHLIDASIDKPNNDLHQLTPNYLRLAEAEAKWLASQKELSNNE